eukprot:TRINITY_DN34132_c0_g1_i1.p1 TRINITY_DN34132_c0_g1~~TRINITY_DN34132_c0_g1_i1.p1  ORF type:complete len:149 (+),score=19.02 TRINITY_DN34132_c0_g1_i1:34-447(+)
MRRRLEYEPVPLTEIVHDTQTARAEIAVAELDAAASFNIFNDIVSVVGIMLSLGWLFYALVSFPDCPDWACDLSFYSDSLEYYVFALPLYPLRSVVCGYPSVELPFICGATITTPLMVFFYFVYKMWKGIEEFALNY